VRPHDYGHDVTPVALDGKLLRLKPEPDVTVLIPRRPLTVPQQGGCGGYNFLPCKEKERSRIFVAIVRVTIRMAAEAGAYRGSVVRCPLFGRPDGFFEVLLLHLPDVQRAPVVILKLQMLSVWPMCSANKTANINLRIL